MATQQRDAPGGAVEEAKEKGQELVSQAQEKTQELRSEAGTRLRGQVEERSTQAGEQMQSLGQALRHSSEQLRGEGKETPARAVETAADKIEDLGGYLRSANADRILHDVERFARRRPWLTAAAGATIGFVASRFLKASSERRYEHAAYTGHPSQPVMPETGTGGV